MKPLPHSLPFCRLVSVTGALLAFAALVSCGERQSSSSAETEAETTTRSERHRAVRAERAQSIGLHDSMRKALKDARDLLDPAERHQALLRVAEDGMERMPEITGEAIQAMDIDFPERADWIGRYLEYLLQDENGGLHKALEWAMAFPNVEDAQNVRNLALVHFSESQPQEARASLLDPTRLSRDGFDPAAMNALEQWTAQSPQEAAEWSSRLTMGEVREEAMHQILKQWIFTDARAALDWHATLGNDVLKSETELEFARALTIVPEPIRESLLHEIPSEQRGSLDVRVQELLQEPIFTDPDADPE